MATLFKSLQNCDGWEVQEGASVNDSVCSVNDGVISHKPGLFIRGIGNFAGTAFMLLALHFSRKALQHHKYGLMMAGQFSYFIGLIDHSHSRQQRHLISPIFISVIVKIALLADKVKKKLKKMQPGKRRSSETCQSSKIAVIITWRSPPKSHNPWAFSPCYIEPDNSAATSKLTCRYGAKRNSGHVQRLVISSMNSCIVPQTY